jgi:hypothetical protein
LSKFFRSVPVAGFVVFQYHQHTSDIPYLTCWWAKTKEEFEAELKVSLAHTAISKVWLPVKY